ncbi:MAG TPA: PQQ-dependent sugar dehydrogenase, partial [bacterium]|nr:PQQ-dependent sugar dehydrogenase [bacterium]
ASGLDIPWGMAFVPDGRLFVTERPGRLRVIVGGVLQPSAVITLAVEATGESGLLGIAADPGFATNGRLYVYYTYRSGANLFNRVARLAVTGSTAVQDLVLLEGIPGAMFHDGGRIKIGPDGLLYATTGDAGDRSLSQQQASLAGKILRMTRDGAIAPGNPFPGSYVYTLGHRNPQGLAWDSSGTLYSTEHGDSSNDEVNRIGSGLNYGWPVIVGRGNTPPFIDPIFLFFPETCAPSGATFVSGSMIPEWNQDLLFTCLRGVHLHRLRLSGPGSDTVAASETLYSGTYGRMRDVVMGPDGAVYVSTSNGSADVILRVGR